MTGQQSLRYLITNVQGVPVLLGDGRRDADRLQGRFTRLERHVSPQQCGICV